MSQKHLYIRQTTEITETNVPSSIIKKLYNIIKRSERDDDLTNSSNFIGKITTGYTYKQYIDAINERFLNLEITPKGLYILFDDSNVEEILLYNFNRDGEGILVTQVFHPTDGFRVGNTHVFRNNTSIETFDELNQLQYADTIGDNEFQGCVNLRSINLSNVIYIGQYAFNNCTELKIDLSLPSLNRMSIYAFASSGIISISNLGNITILPEYAFSTCQGLTTISEGALSKIIQINNQAFYNCIFLKTISSMPNLLIINDSAFNNCYKLETNILNTNIAKIGNYAFMNCISLVIPDLDLPNCDTIGNYAFYGVTVNKITKIAAASIGNNVFDECTALTQIDSNALTTVTSIGEYAFRNCKFTNINIPNIEKIYYGAFAGNNLLISVDFGDQSKITTIGSYAFNNCESLIINDLNLTGLTSLGQYAFYKNKKLKKITSLGNLTYIPEYCFASCSDLISVSEEAMRNVTKVSYKGFNSCSSLIEIDLSNVKIIEGHAFSGCSSLTNIHTDLHNLENFTWDHTFTGCPITGDIVLSGLSDSCTTNPSSLFKENNGTLRIRSFTCTSGKASEFGGRGDLTSNPNLLYCDISQVNTIETIYYMTFDNCTSLKLIYLPSSLKNIDRTFCSGCTSLEAIVLPVDVPPTLLNVPFWFEPESHVFCKISTTNSTFKIYVPDASVETYKTTPYYDEYADHYAPLSTYVRPSGI